MNQGLESLGALTSITSLIAFEQAVSVEIDRGCLSPSNRELLIRAKADLRKYLSIIQRFERKSGERFD